MEGKFRIFRHFLQFGCPFCCPAKSVKACTNEDKQQKDRKNIYLFIYLFIYLMAHMIHDMTQRYQGHITTTTATTTTATTTATAATTTTTTTTTTNDKFILP